MSTPITAAREALDTALSTVPGLRVYTDPGARVDPPGAVVSLPDLRWEAACPEPTTAVFEIAVVAKLNDRAIEVLAEMVLDVTEAIIANTDGVVLNARTGVWDNTLPAYLIETEIPL